MKEDRDFPHCTTDWSVRFLCDSKTCIHKHDEVNIYQGIAQEISTHRLHLLSDHQICPQKNLAMHLMIPPVLKNAPQRIIKIIGHTTATRESDGKFLAEIDFTRFEKDGKKELESNLLHRLR